MTSDESKSTPDSPYRPRGTGFPIGFMCGRCGKTGCQKLGSGRRHVLGLLTDVCSSCKQVIDARIKNAVR